MILHQLALLVGSMILVHCVVCLGQQRPQLGEQACLSGVAPEYLCTMQLALNSTDQGPLERSLQNKVDLPPNDTARVGYTVDPLLQTRYLGAGGELRPWLPEAPSVFPDQQLVVSGASGGFLSGKQVKTTAFVDYFWCSDSSCEAVLDLTYLQNECTGTCDYGLALAAFPNSVAGFGLPHSIESKPQPQDFVTRDIPAQGGSGVEGSLRCNKFSGERAAGTLVDGSIHVVPTRSSAQFIDRTDSALAGFSGMYEYLGQCTTFLFPNSHWYASKQLFGGWQACSNSSATVVILGVAGSALGYAAGSSVYDTKGVGDVPLISIWPSLGVPCEPNYQRPSLYRTCLDQDLACLVAVVDGQEDYDGCSPDLGNPGCFLLVNVTAGDGSGALTLWGVNITSRYFPNDGFPIGVYLQKGVAVGSYPPRFSSMFASACAEATMYPDQPVSCLRAPGGYKLNTSVVDHNYTLFDVLKNCSSLGQLADQQCHMDATAPSAPVGTWDFLRAFTNTFWLTNASSVDAELGLDCVWHNGAVHGFGQVNMASVGLALTVLGANVQRELLLASSGALSNIDSILKWPGALFLFVLSFIAAIGAVSQGRDLWDSMNRRSWSYWVMLLVTVFVVGVGALLPVGFAAAGELTSYSNNKQIDGISYLQLAVDIPDYQAVSVKGSQQLVALVALKTSYESSIVVPGVLYGFTTGVLLAILAYSWWRWFSPSKCEAAALGAARSQSQTVPLLPQTAAAAATAPATAGTAMPAAAGSPSKRSGGGFSKHKSSNGSLEVELPQQHVVPAGVSTPQQVARTVSAPQQASGGDRAPRALSHRHRILTL